MCNIVHLFVFMSVQDLSILSRSSCSDCWNLAATVEGWYLRVTVLFLFIAPFCWFSISACFMKRLDTI